MTIDNPFQAGENLMAACALSTLPRSNENTPGALPVDGCESLGVVEVLVARQATSMRRPVDVKAQFLFLLSVSRSLFSQAASVEFKLEMWGKYELSACRPDGEFA